MYHFFLILLMFVSIILIFLIMIQQGDNIDSSYSIGGSEKLFTHANRNKLITYITVFFAILFFVFVLALSNVHVNHNKTINLSSILDDQ
ncbi:preprotein translocase subunit SecG [Buchnera aphidicola]|uniref:preprotein translocase subunit SecG n=1 Tax=Buchnera aphidicola TaxID=9 RepID=UPI0034641405